VLPDTVNLPPSSDFSRAFAETLAASGLHAALRMLNRTTCYRFTGVYCFEPDWVRSVALFDRENPHLQVGADVRMKESYCMYTGRAAEPIVIEDAAADGRWIGHAARDSVLSYVAVPLRDSSGSLGTLCHFDFCSRAIPAGTIDLLVDSRGAVEAHLAECGIVADLETRLE
jgi:GAF domain-containing protein